MRKMIAGSLAAAALLLGTVGARPAGADPALSGEGYAFGGTVTVGGNDVLPPTPESSAGLPATTSDADTLVAVPAGPLIVSGTLNSAVTIHQASDVAAQLTHPVTGPFNARAMGQVEDLDVLLDVPQADVSLVSSQLITGEVVAKCVGDEVTYSANSDAVDLAVAGEGALGDLADQVIDALFPGLDPVDPIVNLEETVVTELADGLAVDAVVVTLLEAADPEVGLAQVRLGHAELSGVTCGDPASLPECSDTTDNDGDGVIDADDPGCHTDGDATNPDSYDPNDDDESDGGGTPACSDTTDNDGDGVIDADDPGCHTDGDATNPDSYDPNDDDESNGPDIRDAGTLPTTGGSLPLVAVTGVGLALLAVEVLRRRAVG